MSPEKLVAVLFLIALMFHTGTEVDRLHLFAVLKDYGLLARAFLANFIVVPLLGVAAVRLFHLSEPIAIGVLLMAISPGVPFVVLSGGRKKGGSLGLAVSLAFLMPVASIITIPITARLVMPSDAEISANSLLVSLLAFQLVPLLLGIFVGDRAPALAQRLRRPIAIVVIFLVVTLLVLLGRPIGAAVASVYGSRGMFAMLCLVVLSLVTGWILGGRRREFRRTLAIGTALRNIGLALVIATTAFRGTQTSAAVMTYLVIQFAVVTLIGVFFARTAEAPGAAPSG
jgi:bile acid:Na+ symporter, BASS family